MFPGVVIVQMGNRHRIPYTEFTRFQEALWDQMIDLVAPDIEDELFGLTR